jgi:ribosomal protein S18 acetylase RimI-like enzyme
MASAMCEMSSIIIPSTLDNELYNAILALMPQLSSKKSHPSWEEMESILRSKSSTLLVARYPNEHGPIVGMLTLVIYRIPSGLNGHINDVIVDSQYRRKGIGRVLIERALILARDLKVIKVNLTSNPLRKAANQLYSKIGFQKRETNVYYIDLR